MVSEILLSYSRLLKKQVYEVDFVILCIGRFSDVPKIPESPPDKGPEVFDGKVIHAVDFANMDNESAHNFVRGKRVPVTGFHKFAMDIAMECAAANGSMLNTIRIIHIFAFKIPLENIIVRPVCSLTLFRA